LARALGLPAARQAMRSASSCLEPADGALISLALRTTAATRGEIIVRRRTLKLTIRLSVDLKSS
jgi:hypothetical protein